MLNSAVAMEGNLRCSIRDDSLSGRYEEICERICGITRTYFWFLER